VTSQVRNQQALAAVWFQMESEMY